MSILLSWLRALDELILPPALPCPFCREREGREIGCCCHCLDSLAVNWKKGKIRGYPYYSLFSYQGLGRRLIHGMKYQNKPEIARAFGILLAVALREESALAKFHYLVPVPLHLSRLSQRGFNQTEIMADSISRYLKKPVFTGVVRVRKTAMQSDLNRVQREANLQGAFGMLPGFSLQGKHFLIVDDVITSGATFHSLARLIAGYGGKTTGVFLAHTEENEE